MRKPPAPRIQRPRELRRRVIVPARLRSGAEWGDACILNISSRGLLVHAARPATKGSRVELWQGHHAIAARVVWRDGCRFGVQAEDRIPIEEIAASSPASAFGPTTSQPRLLDRRRRPRTHGDSRIHGRFAEFVSIILIAASLAGGFSLIVEEALGRPLAYLGAALRR